MDALRGALDGGHIRLFCIDGVDAESTVSSSGPERRIVPVTGVKWCRTTCSCKAQSNFNKHGLDFERAPTVLLDPLALTIPDDEHSEAEEKDATARHVLVVHTFEPLAVDRVRVRLISARRPTKVEVHDYEEQR